MHKVDLAGGAVLEKNCVYLIPLAERLALPPGITAVANAKSSSGRLDLLTRTITDGGAEFDRIPEGYDRPTLCRGLPAQLFRPCPRRPAPEPDPLPPGPGRPD